MVVWRSATDWLKQRPRALRLVRHLDRGRGRLRWLDQLNPPPAARFVPDLRDWENRELSAVWIGHATILLRISGLTILTDPVFSHRIGLGMWLATLGPRRQIAAAMKISELPTIDLILLSHAHFDHLDRPSLSRLSKKIPVVTAPATSDLIADLGFRQITELSWGAQHRIDGLSITAREVTHWGARTFYDRHRGFNAYLLESSRRRVLFGGDTAFHERFKDIGRVDLAMFGIGAYDPFIKAHATPEQAWEMANHVRADFVVPIHHSTFRLSHEPMAEPLERILHAAGDQNYRVAIRGVGQSWIHGN